MSSYKNVYKHTSACIIQVLFKEAELLEGDRDRVRDRDTDTDIGIWIDDLFQRFYLIQLKELIRPST